MTLIYWDALQTSENDYDTDMYMLDIIFSRKCNQQESNKLRLQRTCLARPYSNIIKKINSNIIKI